MLKPFLITFVSILILAWLIPAITYTSLVTLVVASIVLTILQKLVQPALKILFLPINIITLGLFSWVINALILWLAILLVPGFHIDHINLFGVVLGSFFSLVFASFAISLIESIIDIII